MKTQEQLLEMRDNNEAYIYDTDAEGIIQFWCVNGEEYVSVDGDVMTLIEYGEI